MIKADERGTSTEMDELTYELRVESLQRLQAANGVACVALMPGANLFYFTGLSAHSSERPIVAFVPATGQLAILLPELEAPAARGHLPGNVRLFT